MHLGLVLWVFLMSAMFSQLKYFHVQVGLGCGRAEIHNSGNSSPVLELRVLLMLYYPLGRSLTRSETFGRSVSSSVPLWFSEPGWVFTAVRRANLGQARDAIFDLVRRPHSFQVYHRKDETFKSHFRSKNMHKCVCGGHACHPGTREAEAGALSSLSYAARPRLHESITNKGKQ